MTCYNYARTLLLNTTQQDRACPGEELIPATYVPMTLPAYLQVLRKTIFGLAPDRFMLNYRAKQLLSLVAGTELQQYVLRLDSRITYDVTRQDLFDPAVFVPTYSRRDNPDGSPSDVSSVPELRIEGKPNAPDFSGLCRYRFQLRNDGSVVSPAYLVERILPFSGAEIQNPEFGSGWSDAMPLRGTGYTVRVSSPSTLYVWTIDLTLAPVLSVSALVASLQRLNPDVLQQLFLPTSDDFRTFQACWNQHPDLAYRLGGLLLAYIYRSHELHQATQVGI